MLVFVATFFVFSGKAYAGNCDTGNNSRINFGGSGNFECDGEVFLYDPLTSYNTGFVTFKNQDGSQVVEIRKQGETVYGWRKPGNGLIPIITREPSKYDADTSVGGKVVCSMHKPENCDLADNWGFPIANAGLTSAAVKAQIAEVIPLLKAQAGEESLQASIDAQCEQKAGPLGFLLCPLYKSIVDSITTITGMQQIGSVQNDGILVKLLIVKPLDASGNVALRDGVQKVVAIANSLYILLFLVIIFANITSFGLDNYTVKKALPRLIIAIILTQFAFLICTLAIDLGNILGFYVPALLGTITRGNTIRDSLAFMFSLAGGNVGIEFLLGGAAFIIALLMAVVILIVLLVAVVYMVARILILYVLVLISPLAFASMVLPGTQSLFKKWANNFVKLIIVFPLVTGLIAVCGVISSILIQVSSNWDPTTDINLTAIVVNDKVMFLAGCLIPVIGLCLIPKMFKLSGDIAQKTGGVAAGYITGKAAAGGKKAVKATGQEAKRATGQAIQNKSAKLAFGARQREQAGGRRGWRGAGAALLAGNVYSTQKRRGAIDAKADKLVQEQTELSAGQANTMSFPQAEDAFNNAAERLRRNPSDVRANADFRATQARLLQLNNTAPIAAARQQFGAAGLGDAYNYASGPNMGDLGDKGPDLSAIDTTAGFTPGVNEYGFEIGNVTTDQLVNSHHSFVQRQIAQGNMQNLSNGVISKMGDQQYRGKVRQQTVDALVDWHDDPTNAASADPQVQARRAEIAATIDVANRTII